MKRFASLAAILLSLTMVLSLAACGQEEPAPQEPSTDPAVTEPADAPATGEGVDLTALRDQIIADCGITDTMNMEADALASQYGIDAAQMAASAAFSASSGAAFAQEVVMIQAVDESAAADIAGKLEARLANIAEQAASYDPDSLALAEKCKVVTQGVYVGMFFSNEYDAMVSAFQSAVG